ncbi:MAG: hypothetical protein KAS63_04120 [Candidatus Heimdallarchaeota archaeon]|nr:hypothetical protein [Candidatus Heimdallarchaeota archaeon]MCK4954521.1 hypothetical protein [Candidatus Heimdallarchaeota archaeon]
MLSQKEIISKLLEPSSYPHEVTKKIELIETNISWIFLTGVFAYKMKKAIKFGDVLDFSTIEKREQACKDEIKLNKRLAPSIYLDVERLNHESIIDSSTKNPIEHLVKMKELPQDSLLSNKINKEKSLKESTIVQIAKTIGQFHQKNTVQPDFSVFDNIFEKWDENFRTTETYPNFPFDQRLKERVYQFLEKNRSFWQDRKMCGKIVDGHGDLILSNIFEINEKIIIFDCIEFNESLRIQDVLEEITFLAMDLDFWGLNQLSDLFIQSYLAAIGDTMSHSSPFIQFYKSYRAYIRAKVYCSLSIQEKSFEKLEHLQKLINKYMNLSSSYKF